MPSLAKKRKTNHFGEITDIEMNYLLTGEDIFNEVDQDLIRQKWNENRDLILTEKYKDSGTRPFAWWQFDHPELRRKITGGKCRPWDQAGFKFGCPIGWDIWDSKNEPVYESQADCLKRYGLSDVY